MSEHEERIEIDKGWLPTKLIQALSAIVFVLASFFANSLYGEVEELSREFRDYKVAVALKYASKEELKLSRDEAEKDLDRIAESQARLEAKIDRLAERLGMRLNNPYQPTE